jgi:hypothetical protein
VGVSAAVISAMRRQEKKRGIIAGSWGHIHEPSYPIVATERIEYSTSPQKK